MPSSSCSERPLAAILCGGRSRRMGRDKALLPHPHGGSLLQHTCALALATGLETICLSRPQQGHRQHLATAPALRQVTVLEEQPPWEGPLLALAKLMTTYPGCPMLLLACDLPNLSPPPAQRPGCPTAAPSCAPHNRWRPTAAPAGQLWLRSGGHASPGRGGRGAQLSPVATGSAGGVATGFLHSAGEPEPSPGPCRHP